MKNIIQKYLVRVNEVKYEKIEFFNILTKKKVLSFNKFINSRLLYLSPLKLLSKFNIINCYIFEYDYISIIFPV